MKDFIKNIFNLIIRFFVALKPLLINIFNLIIRFFVALKPVLINTFIYLRLFIVIIIKSVFFIIITNRPKREKRRFDFISNIYANFSTKILISGTVFLTIYLIIYLIFITLISVDLITHTKVFHCFIIFHYFNIFCDLLELFYEYFTFFLENVSFNNSNELVVNYKYLTLNSFYKETRPVYLLLVYINLIHILIAFYSLCYDYLLKKLTSKNIIILYIISSTAFYILLTEFFILI